MELFENGAPIQTGGPFGGVSGPVEETSTRKRIVDYRLDVFDSFGDGICCDSSNGSLDANVIKPGGSKMLAFSNDGCFGSVAPSPSRFEKGRNDPEPGPGVTNPAPTPTFVSPVYRLV